MTEAEFRIEMKRRGWTEEATNRQISKRDADSLAYSLPMPFEIYLCEKDTLRNYYYDEGQLSEREEYYWRND